MNKSLDDFGSYSILPGRCSVLQFFNGKICRWEEGADYRRKDGKVHQKILPFKNHVLHREDKVYLYPEPKFRAFASISANPSIFAIKPFFHYDEDVGFIFRYNYATNFVIEHFFQYNSSYNVRSKIYKTKCQTYVDSLPVYNPVKIFIKAIVLPSQDEMESTYPFTFYSEYRQWGSCSSNWAISVIHHLNCSSINKLSYQLLDTTLREITEHCQAQNTPKLEQPTCLKPLFGSILGHSKPYILVLSIKNTTMIDLDLNIGHLSISNIWKRFCGNATHVHYIDEYDTWSVIFEDGHWKYIKRPLKCSELTTTYFLHTNFFNRNDTYEIQIQISSFQYAMLNITTQFLQAIKQTKNKFMFYYQWKSRKIRPISNLQDIFKIVFHKGGLSWSSAYNKCLLYNMTLPSFKNQRHVEDMLDFIQEKYLFQPVALFVAHLHSVGILNLFTKTQLKLTFTTNNVNNYCRLRKVLSGQQMLIHLFIFRLNIQK